MDKVVSRDLCFEGAGEVKILAEARDRVRELGVRQVQQLMWMRVAHIVGQQRIGTIMISPRQGMGDAELALNL